MIHELYFLNLTDEKAHSRGWFDKLMSEYGLTEIEVYLAVSERAIGGFFWCKKFEILGDCTEPRCGTINCKEYIARNGKNGVCKYNSGWVYTKGEKLILKRQ